MTEPLPTYTSPAEPQRPGFAVSALVLGILAVILGWVPWIGWVICALAIVFGALSRRYNLGMAGFVMGIVGGSIALIVALAVFGNS